MEGVSHDLLEQAVRLLGNPDLSHDEVEEKLKADKVEDMVARRLCSFVPEAFGVVAVGHMPKKVIFPATFGAPDKQGHLEEFPFSSEPIFEQAKKKGETMYLENPRQAFDAVSARSSVMEIINEAMENGTDYEGAELAIETEVPAEVYRGEKGEIPFWRKVLRDLAEIKIEQ
jgi:hypothetical protein